MNPFLLVDSRSGSLASLPHHHLLHPRQQQLQLLSQPEMGESEAAASAASASASPSDHPTSPPPTNDPDHLSHHHHHHLAHYHNQFMPQPEQPELQSLLQATGTEPGSRHAHQSSHTGKLRRRRQAERQTPYQAPVVRGDTSSALTPPRAPSPRLQCLGEAGDQTGAMPPGNLSSGDDADDYEEAGEEIRESSVATDHEAGHQQSGEAAVAETNTRDSPPNAFAAHPRLVDTSRPAAYSTDSEQPVVCLVVDDNDWNLQVMGKWLEKLNVNFEVASNGSQAVEWAKKRKFKMILMDIVMPVLDGFEATKLIRLAIPGFFLIYYFFCTHCSFFLSGI